MAQLLYGSIDVQKIDKTKLVKGEKGTYLNIAVWINDEVDQFGNTASIQIGQTKEEREAKAPKVYLGNLKAAGTNAGGNSNSAAPAAAAPAGADDDLPF